MQMQLAEAAASAGRADLAAAAAPPLKRVSLGGREGGFILRSSLRFTAGITLLATLFAGRSYAQTLRPPMLEPITNARLEARLRTAADTLGLLQFVVPVALDSLRTAGDSTWPPFLVVAGVDSASARAWLLSLLDHHQVRGLCGPIRIRCQGFEGVRVSLENDPRIGDNAVRLVLRLISLRPRPRTVYYDDEMRRWQAMLSAGIPMLGGCWGAPCWAPGGKIEIVPDFVLTTVAAPDGWHVVGWHREPTKR
jgi:hypothetical protein